MGMAEAQALVWPLSCHYFCSVCGWLAPQGDFDAEPERCHCCHAAPHGSDPWPEGTYTPLARGWTCYHCGETFHTHAKAAGHFGADIDAKPACRIKSELGLVYALRDAEALLTRYQAEDTDLHREIGALRAALGPAQQKAEEVGYRRGLRDMRERAVRITSQVKSGLRNGGARNACDDIAASIADPQVD